MEAKVEAKRSRNVSFGLQRLKPQRAGPPTFEIIVEQTCGEQHQWRIITDVVVTVDKAVEGQQFNAQRRTRNPDTGALTIELEESYYITFRGAKF